MRDEHFTLDLPEVPASIQVTGAVGTEAMNALYELDVHALVSVALEERFSFKNERDALDE